MVLLVSGSTRPGSTNTAALACLAAHRSAVVYDGLLTLPAFVPGSPEPAGFLDALSAHELIVFCTPEYAGTLPGSFKNLLDWTVGSGVLSGRRCSSLNVAAPGRGAGATATLELVLRYVDAAVVPGADVFVPRDAVAEGEITDAAVVDALLAAYDRIVVVG